MITTLVDCGIGKEKLFEIIRDSEFSEILNIDDESFRCINSRDVLRDRLLSIVDNKRTGICILTNKNATEYEHDYEEHTLLKCGNYLPIAYMSHVIILLYQNYYVISKDRYLNPNLGTKINYPW